MAINFDVRLVPIPAIPQDIPIISPLGPLSVLPGKWTGSGFNQIFRPLHAGPSDNFLELNLTDETLEFTEIGGEIPNRGFAQDDVSLFGMTYLQQVADHNVKDSHGNPAGIHIEPGIWINVPATTQPQEVATVARLANIPHGTSLVAQGTASVVPGAPAIDPVDITPFFIGQPSNKVHFPSQTLTNPSPGVRSPDADIVGITQSMVDDPNSVLRAALAGKTITSHTRIDITTTSTATTVPNAGGGISDIAFLDGAGSPNAKVVDMTATFWISDFTDTNGARGTMLQYSQTVTLNFAPLSWPHVSVANLFKPVVSKAPIKDIKDTKHEGKETLKHEGKEFLKNEAKDVLRNEGKGFTKAEIKDHDVPPGTFPVGPGPVAVGPAGPAGPTSLAAAAAESFITSAERPAVGDATAIVNPQETPEEPQ